LEERKKMCKKREKGKVYKTAKKDEKKDKEETRQDRKHNI
jgi:hypothetical protein